MALLDKIQKAKNLAEALANCTVEKYKEYVKCHSLQEDLNKIINDDLMRKNPGELFEEYRTYFATKNLPTKIIDVDMFFYR